MGIPVPILQCQYLSGGVENKKEARMAAPTKPQFEACREQPGRHAKIIGKNLNFFDLNDQIL